MRAPRRSSWLYRNSLSLTLIGLLFLFWTGQYLAGRAEYNKDLAELGQPPLGYGDYLLSGHFLSATFENWESEFFQMGFYVLLTVGLRQQGSSESKKLPEEEDGSEAEKEQVTPESPAPVRRGGWVLRLYENSLSIAFFLLFLLSFLLHLYGSFRHYNLEQAYKHQPPESLGSFLTGSHFWFESFQNWQSEFLAVAAIVLLSIWLRQKGSPESKAVTAPHHKTGN